MKAHRGESLRTLAALRDTLLPKLISGELRVKDAERFIGRAGLMGDTFPGNARLQPGPVVTKAGLEPGAPRVLPEGGIRAATCRTLTPTTSSSM